MIKIQIPVLENLCWSKTGSKNYVKQLLIPSYEDSFNFISIHRGYSIIEKNGVKYCLSSNKNIIPDEFEYVIFSKQKVTEESLLSNEVTLTKWLKHPMLLNFTTDETIYSWNNDFNFIEENLSENQLGLREPQIAALYAILSHLKISDEIGTVVMPTGTGKTETMLATLIANKCQKVLITVPSEALRNQIYKKFYSLGLLKQFGVVGANSKYPKVGIINENFSSIEEIKEFLHECNVVVTTMGLLTRNSNLILEEYSSLFSHLFIDEAHHIEAESWNRVRKSFSNNKILQFTATPFRNDRKRLEGKVIFNFSLKKAQEQGYFKPIKFLPIREYDFKKADILIAEKAVEQLQADIANDFDHILMARCETKRRAEEIFEIYKTYTDLNPVVVYSGVNGKKEIINRIIQGEHKIIVAVNMLGEGFDLPQLKIAAFHDIRKSLPITLQFAGRFTRTSGTNLGDATFIANLADATVSEELSELYAQDSDWNLLLSKLSSDEIADGINFDDFINGFQHMANSKIPFQNIRFAMSAVVFKNNFDSSNEELEIEDTYDLKKFINGIQNYEDLEYKFSDYNPESKTVVIITANKSELEWVNYKEVYGLDWKLTVLYYDSETNLLFVHSSDKSSLYEKLANSVLEGNAVLIHQLNVFRTFYDIKRVSLQNVGLKEFLNRKIRFTMRVGTDIEEALSISEQQGGQKAFVFGSGYEEGNKITLGCSYKGRIWSYLKGDLKEFINWCSKIGNKLIDENIDPNQILRETLIPEIIAEIPDIHPTHIDWDEHVYDYSESKISIIVDSCEFNLANCSLNIVNPSNNREIFFEIVTPFSAINFQKELFINSSREPNFSDFRIKKLSRNKVIIKIGTREYDILEYFKNNIPTVWFADGSALQGNYYIVLKQLINPYPASNLIGWKWDGVDLSKESQHVYPLVLDSIQYKVIMELKKLDFDIIYDDDYSGEIADIITVKEHQDQINIQFYHLKFAKDGNVNTRVDNFYEVCGQAQKSIHWKHKKGKEFFEHLLRRETKVRGANERSRLEKGTKLELERLLTIAKNSKPMNFEIFIVQPSLSKKKTSESILTLLGVTENYLKEVAGINLKIIVSE
ncbi:DEAD/DEAH box helicase [Flavobacterium sp. PL02]|uniref:DEAD/DEAH box helicase n=1 Tax=Flavobacterium sp. PL02 TaxID=3088354 RepID=UPI002B222F8E|nr:DEAD/DEAH box helicase family protein [Flavobacterium sp. PL02]MEA9414356.1 DEAD/DEAH box helicase family protein [Flavobacterium sp. PL02]